MVRRVPGTDTLRQFFQPLQVKGGIPIGIWDEQELAAIRARIAAPPVQMNISRHDGERAFKKVSRCSLQQTEAAFVLLGVTTSGEKP